MRVRDVATFEASQTVFRLLVEEMVEYLSSVILTKPVFVGYSE
jgi:hypothetical protein